MIVGSAAADGTARRVERSSSGGYGLISVGDEERAEQQAPGGSAEERAERVETGSEWGFGRVEHPAWKYASVLTC